MKSTVSMPCWRKEQLGSMGAKLFSREQLFRACISGVTINALHDKRRPTVLSILNLEVGNFSSHSDGEIGIPSAIMGGMNSAATLNS
mmetsp:Transcript_43584/g.132654  ORF Transcript_43584/g.132654 Transcript_43584/m.132654 type:complete len:87 (+) Transcript_43584:961-1221(+)